MNYFVGLVFFLRYLFYLEYLYSVVIILKFILFYFIRNSLFYGIMKIKNFWNAKKIV